MAFIEIPDTGGDALTALTGDVVATGPGSATATIANSAVTTIKINDSAVTTAKINNLAVTSGKLDSSVSTDIANGLINDNNLRILKALGSDIKGLPFGPLIPIASLSFALGDGYAYFSPIYIPTAATITGLRMVQFTNGDYTADNTNQVGLYTFSAGTATKVAESSNNGNLWKAGANAYINADLSSPYSAAAGCYYVGVMYNSSAQTTQPRLAVGGTFLTSGISTFGTTGVRLSWNQGPNTSLQSTYDVTAAFNNNAIFWVVAY